MTKRKPASCARGNKPETAVPHWGCTWLGYDFALGRCNHLYSVAALTDAVANVVERYSYSAYGVQTIKSASGAILMKSAIGNDRSFTGYIKDDETGLLYARARLYATTVSRFISRDPWDQTRFPNAASYDLKNSSGQRFNPRAGDGYVNGSSLYSAYFSPLHTDPFGHDWGLTVANDILPTCSKCDPAGDKKCWKRTDLAVDPTTQINETLTYTFADGSVNGAWRTLDNYNRTRVHEAVHRANYKTIADLVNKAGAGPKFTTEEECKAAVAAMTKDWSDRADKEGAHDQSAIPKPPLEGQTSFDEEWNASVAAGLSNMAGNQPVKPTYPGP